MGRLYAYGSVLKTTVKNHFVLMLGKEPNGRCNRKR